MLTDKTMQLPVFLTGIGVRSQTENISRKNGYKDYQISLITKGRGVFESENRTIPLSKGSFFYFESGIAHSYYSQNQDFCNKWVCFNGRDLSWICNFLSGEQLCVFQSSYYPRYCAMFDRLYESASREKTFRQEAASALLYSLIMEFLYLRNQEACFNISNQKVQQAMTYIETHYYKQLSLEEIAAEVEMSKYTLCKAFRHSYDISVFSYLTKYRLQQAKTLLIETKMSIKEIGYLVGFNDISYFIAIFKKYEHITPQGFRKNF